MQIFVDAGGEKVGKGGFVVSGSMRNREEGVGGESGCGK